MKRLKPTRFPHRKPTRHAFLQIYQALLGHFGCRHWWPADHPFEVSIGAILTQNTAWTNVEKAVARLKKARALSPQVLQKISNEKLAHLIRPAGYFNVKAKRLKSFIRFLWDQFQGEIASMKKMETQKLRKMLLGVSGIGPETADSILLYAVEKRTFVVDAYTRRLLTRHRYLKGEESYEEIRRLFIKLLPKSLRLYNDFHAQIVEAGKTYCRSTPQCQHCPLLNYL